MGYKLRICTKIDYNMFTGFADAKIYFASGMPLPQALVRRISRASNQSACRYEAQGDIY